MLSYDLFKKYCFFNYFCRFLGRSQRWPLFLLYGCSCIVYFLSGTVSCFSQVFLMILSHVFSLFFVRFSPLHWGTYIAVCACVCV